MVLCFLLNIFMGPVLCVVLLFLRVVGCEEVVVSQHGSTYEKSTSKTTCPTPRSTIQFDIEKFLEIIANLTKDSKTNLTMQVNETLIRYNVPTCGATTTPPEPTTTAGPDYVAKCFVCGLETTGIPYDADCADAFAGDFPPLVPQDSRLRARFRKYCRWGDVQNYAINETQPRAAYGRWTGGCSVRWTDVSGVYSQRSCRNRQRAVVGKHFASRRMAKLEMALAHVDDGCITSPAASLLPLSRGISLFAHFHACVCTGNWCNQATQNKPGLSPLMISGWVAISVLTLLV